MAMCQEKEKKKANKHETVLVLDKSAQGPHMHGSMKVMVVGIVLGYACEAQPEGALLLQIDRGGRLHASSTSRRS